MEKQSGPYFWKQLEDYIVRTKVTQVTRNSSLNKKGKSPIEERVLIHSQKNVINYNYAPFVQRLDTHSSIMHIRKRPKCNSRRFV